MALPGITLPSNFPAWLIQPHTAEIEAVYAGVPMRSGHQRLRRVYTVAPEQREVAIFLREDLADDFHAWFENDLQGGALTFAAEVANRGPGNVWYEARFVSDPPYRADPIHAEGGVAWRISATLRLFGAAQYSPPETGNLSSHVLIGLYGRAGGATEKNLSSHVMIGLQGVGGSADLSSRVLIPLDGIATPGVPEDSFFITEGGDNFITEDGDRLMVE